MLPPRARPLIVGFLKARDENIREGNIHRCLANMRKFCDTIVACDDASSDGTREILQREIEPGQLLLIDPDKQDFRKELVVKQEMMKLVDKLQPYWVWWQDADEELDADGVVNIRKLCTEQRDAPIMGGAYRFKYTQLWRSAQWYRTDDGFDDGSFIKLWKWSPGLRFHEMEGTHNPQFPQQIAHHQVAELPWKVIHWGNCGKNLQLKVIQYYGGLGGWWRHLDFERAEYKPVSGITVTEPRPVPFTPRERELIVMQRGLGNATGGAQPEPAMFTVVVPTHNRGWALDEALSSLVAQTYRRWVAIVLDDGSTDNTPAVMEKWQRRDPRIYYARFPRSGAVAMNEIGMRLACRWTEWFTRLGSDDYFEPHKLQLDAMALASGTPWVYGPYRVLRDGALAETCNLPQAGDALRAQLQRGQFAVSWANMALRTSLLAKVFDDHGNFCDPRLKTMEDFLVNTRLARYAEPVFRARFTQGLAHCDLVGAGLGSLPQEAMLHDAIWRVSTDGASSNVFVTGNEDELTRQIIAEETAAARDEIRTLDAIGRAYAEGDYHVL